MIARDARRRRGVASLIEVIASMTLIALLFGAAGALTALMFRLERLGRDDLEATVVEGRLASDFRADVHAASRLGPEGAGGDRLELEGPGGETVVYRADGGGLVREQGGAGRFERYRLRPGTVVRWEGGVGGDGRRVGLILEPPGRPGGAARAGGVVRIEAALGRDHRYGGEGS